MNIAGAMAALNIADLDQAAKHALLVVACHADRYRAAAEVSIARIAADMHVHYVTAWRALYRAVDAGYLAVDKSPGNVSTWRLTSSVLQGVPIAPAQGVPIANRAVTSCAAQEDLATLGRDEGFIDTNKGECDAAIARHPASGAAPGEKPDAPVVDLFAKVPTWVTEALARIGRMPDDDA